MFPDRGFMPPPVGLAGLVSWWQEQAERATVPQPSSWGDGNPLTPATDGADGFEPWEMQATTTDQIREALEQLLRSLGLAASEIPSHHEAQGRVFRTQLAGRRMLVLLDNAASAEQVRPLLPSSPTCCVVVTSRNRLGDLVAHDGAHTLPLDLLQPDEARALKEADPTVRAGRFEVVVVPWQVPAGAVHFTPARFPHSIADVVGE